MRKTKKITNKVVASTLSFTLLLASCTATDESTGSNVNTVNTARLKSTVTNKYSSEEIFKGIYFLEGNFVSEMLSLTEMQSQIPAMTSAQKSELQAFNNEIVNLIKADDPLFFDNLVKDMESTDLYKVKEAYARGAEKIRTVGLTSLNYGKVFGLSDLMIEKGVDFNRPDISSLDLSKEDDINKFADILDRDYGINLDDQLVSFATCNLGVWCAVTMVVAAQSVVGVWVYAVVTKVKFWDPTEGIIANDVFILELSDTLTK